jgi:hypothetical protein
MIGFSGLHGEKIYSTPTIRNLCGEAEESGEKSIIFRAKISSHPLVRLLSSSKWFSWVRGG